MSENKGGCYVGLGENCKRRGKLKDLGVHRVCKNDPVLVLLNKVSYCACLLKLLQLSFIILPLNTISYFSQLSCMIIISRIKIIKLKRHLQPSMLLRLIIWDN